MNSELIERCDLLVSNFEAIIEPFAWSGDTLILAGSSMYAGMNKKIDVERMKECEQILKKEAGIFSSYRGHVKMPLLCKMAACEDPKGYFENVRSISELMDGLKWNDPDFKVMAAMTICDHAKPDEYKDVVDKMTSIYRKMKENHPWLTASEDIPFAAMLAVSDLDIDALTTEMENCYQVLKETFNDKDAVQSLSHVLSVDKTETKEKCSKIEQIWNMLKEKDHKYGIGFELSVLGTLGMADLPVETIVDEIIEADEYLLTKKEFHGIRMDAKTRRMYAALMVMDTHMPPASMSNDSLMGSMLALQIAMEICMLIVMNSMFITMTASR